jgi:hypothetical protein
MFNIVDGLARERGVTPMLRINSDDILKDVSAIDPERIGRVLDEQGYITIKDAAIAESSSAARADYDRCLKASKLHATREKFHFSSLSGEPWRKLAI